MGKPQPVSPLTEFEKIRKEGGLFQGDRDFSAQDRWVKEGTRKIGAKIHYLPVSTARHPRSGESAGVDDLYGDILDPEFLDNEELVDQRKFNLECFVQHKPSKQLLKKYGIDEQREVIFHIPFSVLRDKGLVTDKRFRGSDIGDLVIWDGTWYMVYSSHRGSYFGQRVSHFFTAAVCDRYRLNNIPTEDRANLCPEEKVPP